MSIRGNQAPMDFEMDSKLKPDEKKPWLLAVSKLVEAEKPNAVERPVFVFGSTKKPAASKIPSITTIFDSHLSFNSNPSRINGSPSNKQQHRIEKTSLPHVKKRKMLVEACASTGNGPSSEAPRNKEQSQNDGGSTVFHPMYIPYLITGYIQLAFTLFIVSLLGYIILQFVYSVHHDLQIKAEEYSIEISHQVVECANYYRANRCDPDERVPAVDKLCKEWEICMLRDPKEVGRLKVGAETLAEILNKLIEPLSYKTMIFGTFTLFGTLLLTNSALHFMNARNNSIALSRRNH